LLVADAKTVFAAPDTPPGRVTAKATAKATAPGKYPARGANALWHANWMYPTIGPLKRTKARDKKTRRVYDGRADPARSVRALGTSSNSTTLFLESEVAACFE